MSVNGAFALAAVVLLGFGLVTVARAGRACARQRRVRSVGRPLVGEVTALDPRHRAYYGLYQLTPVVRYRLDEREHEARVANQSGALDIGSNLDLRVDPADPDVPFAVDGQAITATLVVGLGFSAFALVMALWALHW